MGTIATIIETNLSEHVNVNSKERRDHNKFSVFEISESLYQIL